MRHFAGLILALALTAALYFGAGWGRTHILSLAHTSSGLPDRTGLIALACMLGTGLLLGLLLVVPAVSPLATGLPGLALLAWTAFMVVSYQRALSCVEAALDSGLSGKRLAHTHDLAPGRPKER